MDKPRATEITDGISWVGVKDAARRVFDALIPLPYGTSYNAYLVTGKNRKTLIDTVQSGFENELSTKIASITPLETIDYIVMNHAEPDHAGSIPELLKLAPRAQLVATRKGVEMAGTFYRVPESRCLTIRDGDTLDLGGKTLRFIEAPWLHWPETMFTFAVEDKVLFPCDFFGSHLAADNLFDDKAPDYLLSEAKRYYAEIMMPMSRMAASGLDKAKAVSPSIIAPSHGPVYRHPERILEAYEKWVRGPLQPKAVIIYVSMWHSTERLARALSEGISSEGIETMVFDLSSADISQVARELVDASAVVIGSPTVLGGLHPQATFAMGLFKLIRPRLKLAAFVGSYGWGGGAATQVKTLLEPTGCELASILDIKGPPCDKDTAEAAELGRKVARRIKETVK